MKAVLRALAPPLEAEETRVSLQEALKRKPLAADVLHSRRGIELSRLADTDPREGRSQTARENLAG